MMTHTPMNDEILSCPFCGGTDQFVFLPTCTEKTPYDPHDRAFPMVRCMGCYTDVPGKNWDHSGKSAVAKWNTRTPVSNELEEALDKIDGLESDLDSAVVVAFHRGATEWVRMNYPRIFEREMSFIKEGGK